ncbi:MAG TPA: aminotransferase class III-fold pyridoxal phosphate-dependent enzyme [Gaiellaceae bacterium]|nr:aminotransferase class III-fold pyridoxal phosphate-dependent enzyme [Gaiellaceae bacterium]
MNVLEAPPPRFTADEVAQIAEETFGVSGRASDLGSERDQTFLIDDGSDGAVVKISNLGEDPAVLDLEHEAILHVARVDPELPVARPLRERATIAGPDGNHYVRLFERLHGGEGRALDDDAVRAYGATHARLNIALRGFFHPAARSRELLWNVEHAVALRPLLGSIRDEAGQAVVARVLDRYEERVVPRWPHLRAQIVHGDFNVDNVLFDDRGRITGIVDFGDSGWSAQAADFAIGAASLIRGRSRDDVFRIARLAIDGYASRIPFEPEELELLGDLVAARLAAVVTISAWRVERYPQNAGYIQAWDDDCWELLRLFDEVGLDRLAYELGAPRPPVPRPELARRRRAALGSALTNLTYREPVHVVRAEGVWLYDADGRRLLDAYNNVPVVGHCHPRVTEAVVRQTRLVNTHSRYLYEPLIELAERLVASMPQGSRLDTVMLVNSGSEANDLAWRFATAYTGANGGIATGHAYHGVTTAIADFSPEEWPEGYRPENVETVLPGEDIARPAAHVKGGLAATFVDTGFTSDGILVPTREEVAAMVRATHDAGGLFVADEVQAGHGRTGEHLWSFERYGITPDFVTLGKPMGNGYPVAAVVTRAEIVDRFAASGSFFSTFGGNPVAAQAALAVLDVIEDERLVDHAARVGLRLLGLLRERGLNARGHGLLIGVELETGDAAAAVVDRLRDDGILIGRTGRAGNVLKIRPPLVFRDEHGDLLVETLERAIEGRRA